MKAALTTILLISLTLPVGGCAAYLGDRWSDAKDVLNATVEWNTWGVKAQVGPWGGLGVHSSVETSSGAGLIGGQFTGYDVLDWTLPPLIGTFQSFTGFEDDRRRKETATAGLFPLPWLSPLDTPHYRGFEEAGDWRRLALRHTQLEVVIAFWVGGARLGFNAGELGDFLVGWFGLDIYDDDVAGDPTSPTPEIDREAGPEVAAETPLR